MKNDPGFKNLKDAWNKFAKKYSGQDLAGRAMRAAAAGGKATVDRGLQEFPQTFINQAAKDFYSFLTSQDVADGVSTVIRSYDEEKVKDLVDGVVGHLKNPENALKIAKQVKDLLKKASPDDIENQIDGLTNLPLNERMMFLTLFAQIKPVLNEMKDSSEEEVAQKIIEMADKIPSDAIAAQVAALTREVTPERVSKQAHDFVGQLPSPKAVTDIVHGVGHIASDHLDRVSKAATPSEASDILREFKDNASQLVKDTISNDNAAKKTFKKKKGGHFDL